MNFCVARPLGVAACLGVLVLASACARGTAGATISGAELYEACATCHGEAGEGNQMLGAPSIAGLPQWYVTSQIERFQNGFRGKHPDDYEGLRMRAMSRQMLNETEIEAVSAHVAGLARRPSAATLTSANPAAAEAVFPLCASCHGAQGEGSEQLNAPPLAGLDDWYVALQLRKFQAGVRGTAPGDGIGPQMLGMAMTVLPEQIEDVAAYVHRLPR